MPALPTIVPVPDFLHGTYQDCEAFRQGLGKMVEFGDGGSFTQAEAEIVGKMHHIVGSVLHAMHDTNATREDASYAAVLAGKRLITLHETLRKSGELRPEIEQAFGDAGELFRGLQRSPATVRPVALADALQEKSTAPQSRLEEATMAHHGQVKEALSQLLAAPQR